MCLTKSDDNTGRNAAIAIGVVVAADVLYKQLKDKDIFKCKKEKKEEKKVEATV